MGEHDWQERLIEDQTKAELGIPSPAKEQVPKVFIRGQTLQFIMSLPPTIPANYFDATGTTMIGGVSTPTGPTAKLRPVGNQAADALIADLAPAWTDGTNTALLFVVNDTTTFPLGPVEFDVVFTKTITPQSGPAYLQTFRSMPVRFTIVDGVT